MPGSKRTNPTLGFHSGKQLFIAKGYATQAANYCNEGRNKILHTQAKKKHSLVEVVQYHINQAAKGTGLSVNYKEFDSSLFESLALSKDKKGIKELASKGEIIKNPTDSLKHHTLPKFLDLKEA